MRRGSRAQSEDDVSAEPSKRSTGPLWTALLLLLSLTASACASESTGPAENSDDEDDEQTESSASTDDDEEPEQKDAGKVDAGIKDAARPKLDATVVVRDAKAAEPEGDAEIVASPDASEPKADAAAPREDLAKGDGKDVITIGDSWMKLTSTGIQQSLVKASGQPYRTYGVPGTRMLNGQIPNQYAMAKRADPDIKTVVMTGGGNDILQANLSEACAQGTAACTEQLEKIGAALSELWAQMSKDGVLDVVHIKYSSNAGSGVKDREANDKALSDACAAVPAPLRCHLLATDDLVKGELRSDGIHPSDPAYDRIGKAVFDLMVKEGMRR